MANIFDLAKAFLVKAPMTHKKLQKLCYYAKAWYLALYDENLIEDDFEAWVHGPVCPELYQEYKDFGFEDIPQIMNVDGIPEEFQSFADEVYRAYGHLTGNELELLTHMEKPWLNARIGYKEWQRCVNIIREDDMKEYYRKQMEI